ncbi:MAG TPA: Beta-galactosidase C-terminal domain, partial [Candidatus Nitrosopolaris sp.]|nr:Beta-galactosidase C-terminal domain [Candidatus Nitrosopolaris sp.]
IGTRPDPGAMGRILRAVWTEAGIKPVLEAPAGVSAVRRSGPRSSLLFLLNHRDAHVEVPVADAGVNLVDGSEVHRGLLRLGPRGVAVIREGW